MKLINVKVRRWGSNSLESVLSRVLRDHGPGLVCGGYARWALLPAPFKPFQDIDFFPFSKEGEAEIHAILQEHGAALKRESKHAVTFQGEVGISEVPDPIELQVIRFDRFPGQNAREILSQFSVSLQQAALISPSEGLISHLCVEDDQAGRVRLVYEEEAPGPRQFSALLKYQARGYKADYKEFLAYCDATEEGPVDPDDFWNVYERRALDEEYAKSLSHNGVHAKRY